MASGDVECGKQKHKCFVTTDRKYFSTVVLSYFILKLII